MGFIKSWRRAEASGGSSRDTYHGETSYVLWSEVGILLDLSGVSGLEHPIRYLLLQLLGHD